MFYELLGAELRVRNKHSGEISRERWKRAGINIRYDDGIGQAVKVAR